MALMDETYERLMQDALDGSATPEDFTRLEAWMARTPGARERYAELETVFRALAAVPMSEPPVGIAEHVMSSIAAGDTRLRARRGWREELRAAFLRRPALQLGYALAAGVAIGATAFGLLWNRIEIGNPPSDALTGSMAPSRPTGPVALRRIDLPGARLDIEARPTPGGLSIDLRTRSEQPVEVVLDYPVALDPVVLEPSAGAELHARPGQVTLRAAGDIRHAMRFTGSRAAGSSLGITLRSGGQESHGELVPPGAEGGR